jgi:hypothetical protein
MLPQAMLQQHKSLPKLGNWYFFTAMCGNIPHFPRLIPAIVMAAKLRIGLRCAKNNAHKPIIAD